MDSGTLSNRCSSLWTETPSVRGGHASTPRLRTLSLDPGTASNRQRRRSPRDSGPEKSECSRAEPGAWQPGYALRRPRTSAEAHRPIELPLPLRIEPMFQFGPTIVVDHGTIAPP